MTTNNLINLDERRPTTALQFLDAWADAASDENRTPDPITRAHMHEFTHHMEQAIWSNPKAFNAEVTDLSSLAIKDKSLDVDAVQAAVDVENAFFNSVKLTSQNIGTLYAQAQKFDAMQQASKNNRYSEGPEKVEMQERANETANIAADRFNEIKDELGLAKQETTVDPAQITAEKNPQAQKAEAGRSV